MENDMLNLILKMIDRYSLPIVEEKTYDFTNPALISDMEELSKQFIENKFDVSIPPLDTLLIQRKIGGIFLLAQRFRARVELHKIISNYT